MPTKESREKLKGPVSLKVFTEQMANSLGTVSILDGDLNDLKHYMKDLFSEPVRTSSIEGYEEFKKRLMKLGAKAVGLSGGGPTQFAICESREVCELVLKEAENFYKKLKVKHIGRPNKVGSFMSKQCLSCVECQSEYPVDKLRYFCNCGGLFRS